MAWPTYTIISLLGMLIVLAFWLGDHKMLWNTKSKVLEVYWWGLRDEYFLCLCILPSLLSHLATIWGHYYRADAVFQESIVRVSSSDKKQKTPFWEKRDSYFNFTVKYWFLVLIAVFVNCVWFAQPMLGIQKSIDKEGWWPAVTAFTGYASGYAAMGACGMILFLVLRRSLLHALGFTYADLLPLHHWMGILIIFWSVVHTVGYMAHYIMEGEVANEINWDGETRGPQNIVGFVALFALCVLGLFSIPYMRRRFYTIFMFVHRYGSIVTFAGTLMHYPYFMTWYYVIPSMCLFLTDRFVPKIVQAFNLAPDVLCTFDKDCDILTIVIVSKNKAEPLKPYFPGDYVNLEIVGVGKLHHPFTIASYWPEDPYSMTLYVRSFNNKDSWTHAVAKMCGDEGKAVTVPCNIDGVFGDRRHDYLGSNEIVIFSAGAAITTFMPLIKAIAAQIELAGACALRMHLVCTFRFESELYSYGEFMHRITHDPRFTSWLQTEIYITQPGVQPLSAVQTVRAPDNKSKVATPHLSTSSSDSDNSSMESATILSSGNHSAGDTSRSPSTNNDRYGGKMIPTFGASQSVSASTMHARRDMFLTTFILFVPVFIFIVMRFVPWEGSWNGEWRWCRTTRIYDQNMTNKCMWNYTMSPGVVHIAAASCFGYLGLWFARRRNYGSSGKNVGEMALKEIRQQAEHLQSVFDNQIQVKDGSIAFTSGRLIVQNAIDALVAAQVGMKNEQSTTVFVGGPEGFLHTVQEKSNKAPWIVDLILETWSP